MDSVTLSAKETTMGLYLRSVKDSGDAASQCRALGVSVGDTITGRENGRCGYWHEARLTLLWLGDTGAAWREQSRTNEQPEWSAPREAMNWTLECRRWRKTSRLVG